MPPKAKEVKGKQPPPITRPSISDTTLLYVPEDALEGFQGRIEKGIHWTVVEEAGRYHRSLCCNNERPQVSFTEALENKIKNSLISGFLDEESNLTLDEQWELLPLTLWDNEKCANEEGKVCFRNRNCITDDMLKLIKKAVKAGDRNVLKEDLKAVTVLRVNDSKITTLDEGLKGYPNLINLNLCCNLISEVTMPLFPHNLKILELQSNAVRDIKQLIEHLPPNLIYLGLSRNLLTNDSVIGMLKLPQHLTALDISDNDIYELNPVLHAVASLPNLTSLILAGNPCSVCAAYARTLISLAPNLKWLDCREILSSDRSEDHFEPHPDDLRSSYFYFTIFRIMSVPPPPRVEKGTTQTFHVEFELPLLDAQRRAFLMFRRNESLTEMLPAPEDEEEWPVSKYTSLHMAESKATVDPEASSQNTDVYAPLTAKISREIKHYTIFESNRVSWNKIMNFQEPAFRIFCPDLVALRNTLRTVVTLRLVYTQTVTTKSKPLTKSSHVFKPPPPDQRVVLATIRCALRRADWSQPSQHFHWDDTLGTHDAIHWGDGDLSVLQYTQTAAKPTKGGKDLDLISVRQPVPDCLTCHFGFGIETLHLVIGSARWGHDLFSSLRMAGAPHERWGSQLEYLLSCLGYAVGIGNLWRFPYLCYRNGGGAFLIPYFLTLFICGIPLVYLETTLGQFASAGCVSVFNINPLFKGAGYAAIVLNVIAVTYFASIMSYPILYIYHSFSSPLPWQSCGNSWNTDKCTEITGNASFLTSKSGSITTPEDEFFHIRLLRMSPSINEIGGIVWPVFWCNVFCWIIVYLCICNGVKSVGKIVYFTVSFPYVVLCVMLIRGVTLPGAWQGILFYILPDWEQLKKPKVWADAATQIFYSLGPGWGGLVSMASFNKFHYNNLRSSIIIPLVNSATSIWAGFVVFSVLGFAAERAGVPVGQVATAGPGLAFVTYPAAVSLMPLPNFWAITFFVMLFFLGIDTMFVTIEAVIAGILDEFPTLRVRKKLITVLMCLALFLLSIICNTEGGLHVLGLLDAHVAIACVPIVCLLEVVAAVYTYGTRKLSYDMQFMTGQRLRPFWLVLWRYILPTILLIIIIYTLREASGLAGWSVAMASVICIPIHAGWVIYQSKGTLWRRIRDGCRPSSDWGPMDPEIRQRWIAGMTKQAGGAGLPLTDLDVSDS